MDFQRKLKDSKYHVVKAELKSYFEQQSFTRINSTIGIVLCTLLDFSLSGGNKISIKYQFGDIFKCIPGLICKYLLHMCN